MAKPLEEPATMQTNQDLASGCSQERHQGNAKCQQRRVGTDDPVYDRALLLGEA